MLPAAVIVMTRFEVTLPVTSNWPPSKVMPPGRTFEAADVAEVVVGADAEDAGVDRGGTEVGVGTAEDQGTEAGLGETGLGADIGEVAADGAAAGEGDRGADVDGAVLHQLDVVGAGEGRVPDGEVPLLRLTSAGRMLPRWVQGAKVPWLITVSPV